jgi:hypothetical protein
MANFRSFRFGFRHGRGFALFVCAAGFVTLSVGPATAQQQTQPLQQTQGFAVERFYPSAPGGGWFVMDDINISGGLGGAISLTGGYALNPLEVSSPKRPL